MSLRGARRRDLRLVPVALVAWLAASLSLLSPDSALPVAGVCGAGALGALAAARARRGSGRTAWAVAAVALAFGGAVAVQTALALPARQAAVELDISGGRALALDATVVGKVEPTIGGWRFDAIAHAVSYGDERHTLEVPIEVRAAEAPAGLDLGAEVGLRGTAFAAEVGERAVLVVRADREVVVRRAPQGVFAVASALRHGLLDAVAGLPQPAAGLIAGIAVGDTSAVTDELDLQMKAASLSHLTAVSGANCALVVGIAFGGAALCGARRGVRVAIGLAALAGFVVLVSPEPSVVRAAAMAAIAMTGLVLGRIGAGVSILCLAVTVLLVIDPWLAGSLAFALSAAATGALLLAAGPLADGLARGMPRPLALALAVPLAAQLACGPLLILIAPTVPAYGVLANMLAGPAAPIGTIVGLLACLTTAVPVLSQGLAALAWLPAAWIAGTAQLIAALPGNAVPWLAGWPGMLTLAVVGVAIGTVVVARGSGWSRRARAAATFVLAVTGGVLVATGPLAAVVERARSPADWAIVACDVGQGDAVLLRSAGQIALVDTGPEPEALRRCLDRFAIDRIDVLVLTHFDLDHRGGVDAVAGRVGLVLHGPPTGPGDERVLAALTASGARTVEAHAGMTGRLGEATWRVRWPPAGSAVYRGNDGSVVLDIAGGAVPHTLLLGDLSAGPQAALLATARLRGGFDVVKVAHHGSADQDSALYGALGARVALVTVGENDYGHPRAEILDLLTRLRIVVVRTDTTGAAALWVEDGRLLLWRDHADVSASRAPG